MFLIFSRTFDKKLSYPFSNCRSQFSFDETDQHGKTTTEYFDYFQSKCFIVCFLGEIIQTCSESFDRNFLKDYFMNITLFSEYFIQIYEACPNEILAQVSQKFIDQSDHEICEPICPVQCNSVKYSIQSYQNFKGEEFSSRALVNIYYPRLESTLITQMPKVSSDEVFSNCGGLLGK